MDRSLFYGWNSWIWIREYAPKMFEIEVGPRFTKEEGCSRVVSEFVIRRQDSEFDDGSLRELCDNRM